MPNRPNTHPPLPTPSLKRFGGSLLLWFGIFLLINTLLFREPSYTRRPYSAFINQVEAGQVSKVEKISIVPRGMGALGYTLQMPEEDRFLMTEDEIRGQLMMLLGGRSAEELMLGRISTGASDDIQKATDLAERFVTIDGMSEALGPIAFDRSQPDFLEGVTHPRRNISSHVSESIDRAVKDLIEGAHTVALAILQNNRSLIETAAQQLLETEVLEGEALSQILHQVQAPTQLQDWLRTGKVDRLQRSNSQYQENHRPDRPSREAIAPVGLLHL